MKTLQDQLGTTHTFATSPLRIVSLVPSQTELLYDLGLENRIIGITKFCVHPYHLKPTKVIIGGTKQVNFDKITALAPDIIIANKEENTEEMVNQLRKIAPVWVTDIATLDDNYDMIAQFGELFDCRIESRKITDKIRNAAAGFAGFMNDVPERRAAYFIWREPYMAAGAGTFINEMMKLNKFINIYGSQGRYPEVELRKIRIDGDPDLVLLSSEPYPFKEEHAFEFGRFTHHAKTIFVDGEMFSWYGSRLLKAFQYFTSLQNRLK